MTSKNATPVIVAVPVNRPKRPVRAGPQERSSATRAAAILQPRARDRRAWRGRAGDVAAAGTRFHHKVGFGPWKIADYTLIEESEPPRRLKLRTRARPLGTAMVTLELLPHADSTRVVMIEEGGDPLTALMVFNPLTDLLVHGRNDESLRRLKQLAEDRGPSMEQAAAP